MLNKGFPDPASLGKKTEAELKQYKIQRASAAAHRERSEEYLEFLDHRRRDINGPDPELFAAPPKRRPASNQAASGSSSRPVVQGNQQKRQRTGSNRGLPPRAHSETLDDDDDNYNYH